MRVVNICYLGDCLPEMEKIPDNRYDLAIVDPPYFKGAGDPKYYNSHLATSGHKPIDKTWIIPDEKYFTELLRVTKKQIIWGVNNYAKYIPHSSRIVWDKVNDNTPFSQAEIASYSEGVKVYLFRYKWNGMLQQNMKNKEKRIQPTQKPVALYKWLLTNYAKPGDTILDTHVGSGSIRIACHDLGFYFEGWEKDPGHWEAQRQRFLNHTRQDELFDKKEIQELAFQGVR